MLKISAWPEILLYNVGDSWWNYPETKDICKDNGGPVDACWSSSFHQGLRGSLALQKDKLKENGLIILQMSKLILKKEII